ncbi:hypothetical protein BH09BAC2_BH09BAC2_01440 [soil metagenome]
MRFIPTLFYILLLLIVACNSPEKQTTEQSVVPENTEDATGCYMQVLKRDTFAIKIEQSDNNISGKLMFDNYEKDGSTGTVHGTIEGNILKLWYNFASEGMNSVMEIYFKKEGQTLLRGIGNIASKDDSTYYSDPASIKYHADQTLSRTSCETIAIGIFR